jgi:hypothetical protein
MPFSSRPRLRPFAVLLPLTGTSHVRLVAPCRCCLWCARPGQPSSAHGQVPAEHPGSRPKSFRSTSRRTCDNSFWILNSMGDSARGSTSCLQYLVVLACVERSTKFDHFLQRISPVQLCSRLLLFWCRPRWQVLRRTYEEWRRSQHQLQSAFIDILPSIDVLFLLLRSIGSSSSLCSQFNGTCLKFFLCSPLLFRLVWSQGHHRSTFDLCSSFIISLSSNPIHFHPSLLPPISQTTTSCSSRPAPLRKATRHPSPPFSNPESRSSPAPRASHPSAVVLPSPSSTTPSSSCTSTISTRPTTASHPSLHPSLRPRTSSPSCSSQTSTPTPLLSSRGRRPRRNLWLSSTLYASTSSSYPTFTLTSRRPPKYFVRLKEPVELLDEYGKSYSPEPKFLEKRQCTEMDFARADAESVTSTVFVEGEGMVDKRIMTRTRPEEGAAGTVSVFGSKVLLYNVSLHRATSFR